MRSTVGNLSSLIAASIIIIFISTPSILLAQWDLNFSTSQEYNSNPFRSPLAESDFISSFDGGIQRVLGSVNLLYYGSYTAFNQSSDRNYYWHQLGAYYENENSVYGFYGEQRLNKTDYSYFDYYNITGYYRQIISSQYLVPTLNIAGTYKKYNELKEYDNMLFSAGISLNKAFETKTTFIFTGTVNYKYYFNSAIPTDTVVSMGFGRRGKQTEHLTTTQLFSNLRIAQSLFENTGAALYYTNRYLIGENGSMNSSYNYGYGDESDLFDDPVSRNENALGVELTQIVTDDLMIKTGYEYSSRLYPNQGIYINSTDYETGVDRSDEQNYFYIGINKIFSLDSDEMFNLNTGLNYGLINKKSNSYWYEYSGSNIALNISLQF